MCIIISSEYRFAKTNKQIHEHHRGMSVQLRLQFLHRSNVKYKRLGNRYIEDFLDGVHRVKELLAHCQADVSQRKKSYQKINKLSGHYSGWSWDSGEARQKQCPEWHRSRLDRLPEETECSNEFHAPYYAELKRRSLKSGTKITGIMQRRNCDEAVK